MAKNGGHLHKIRSTRISLKGACARFETTQTRSESFIPRRGKNLQFEKKQFISRVFNHKNIFRPIDEFMSNHGQTPCFLFFFDVLLVKYREMCFLEFIDIINVNFIGFIKFIEFINVNKFEKKHLSVFYRQNNKKRKFSLASLAYHAR